MTKRIALYAGSFDPLTNGHLDVLRTALSIADVVHPAIGIQPSKTPLFSFDERVDLIRQVSKSEFGRDADRIEVISFDGLVVDAAHAHGASIMIRGIRDGTDLDYENADVRNEWPDGPGDQNDLRAGKPRDAPDNGHARQADRRHGRRRGRLRSRRRRNCAYQTIFQDMIGRDR